MLLKRTLLLILLIIILASSISTAVEICETSLIRTRLKSALYNFLTNPSEAEMTLAQIKDLLIFYLNIPTGEATIDCSIIGINSNQMIGDIVGLAENITFNGSCSDNTLFGECSTTKPKYCYAGHLNDQCDICGCDNKLCNITSGKCITESPYVNCNVNSNCGTDGFTGGFFCQNNNVYRNLSSFTCLNPNTEDSQCSENKLPTLTLQCSGNDECVEGMETCQEIPETTGTVIVNVKDCNNDYVNTTGLRRVYLIEWEGDIIYQNYVLDIATFNDVPEGMYNIMTAGFDNYTSYGMGGMSCRFDVVAGSIIEKTIILEPGNGVRYCYSSCP
ncbi:MAG: hypothetical protein ABII01_00715 [Candidatus Woesearchaeota archaeon]